MREDIKTLRDRKRLPRKHLISSQDVEFITKKLFAKFIFLNFVIEFDYNLSFWVLSQFEFLSFVTI